MKIQSGKVKKQIIKELENYEVWWFTIQKFPNIRNYLPLQFKKKNGTKIELYEDENGEIYSR